MQTKRMNHPIGEFEDLLLARRNNFGFAPVGADHWLQKRFEAECKREYRKLYPRRKFDMRKSQKQNTEVHGDLYSKWKACTDKWFEIKKAMREKADERLDDLANSIEIPLECHVTDREDWTLFHHTSSYLYSSQGWGAEKYAKASAQQSVDHCEDFGFLAEIREDRREHSTDYDVYVALDSLGVEILKRKSMSLREWVRRCWAKGVNPRVYNPFLPHGFEEKAGLDYFGGYVKGGSR